MKTKRRQWHPPTLHPPAGVTVLVVVLFPESPSHRPWLATCAYADGHWGYESPEVRCRVRAWAYLPPIPETFPWERSLPPDPVGDPLAV